jgi:3-methyl-2-oxobutanoate hydroxymethyltransferase
MNAKPAVSVSKVTIESIREMKAQHQPVTFITAYDYPTGRLVDEAGVDLILVGDTLSEVVLGYESTLPVTFEAMLHHTRAVRRAVKSGLLVADMPYGSYHSGEDEAVRQAIRFVKEAGAQAVKLEGGVKRVHVIERLLNAEIPVMAHLGLTPQSLLCMGSYKVQAKDERDVEQLLQDALTLDQAGVFAMVLDCIPREVAAMITAEVSAVTLGIGAGPDCDGQVLVLHDILGLSFRRPAKFVRQYGNAGSTIAEALTRFKTDVEARMYPSDEESYHVPASLRASLDEIARRVKGGSASPSPEN